MIISFVFWAKTGAASIHSAVAKDAISCNALAQGIYTVYNASLVSFRQSTST